MNFQKHLRILLFLFYTLLTLAAAAFLLPSLLPFLLAAALAAALERPIVFLTRKARLKRPLAVGIVVLLLTVLLLGGSALLLRRLWYEIDLLTDLFPKILDAAQPLAHRLESLLYRITVALPPQLQSALESALDGLSDQITRLLSDASARVLVWTGTVISALPRVFLFLFTTLLATYFIGASRPTLLPLLRRQVPNRWLPKVDNLLQRLKDALGGWLRAQGILLAVTFLMLTGGFLLMGANPALLLAAGVALLDALPVFGTGTVLLPWAAISLLKGSFHRAIALLVLYAAILVTRNLLEPKLIAHQVGLHPLAALLTMYLGFTLFGIVGLLLAPLAAVILRQLHMSGIVRLWK